MPTYRAYRLDNRRHIKSAEWLDAPNDAVATDLAEDMCEEGTPTIELWQQARRVEEIDCDNEA